MPAKQYSTPDLTRNSAKDSDAEPLWKDRSKRRLSLLDRLSLVGIFLVVVFVSLPRLRGFVVTNNQIDARETMGWLAETFFGETGGVLLATGALPAAISGARTADSLTEPDSSAQTGAATRAAATALAKKPAGPSFIIGPHLGDLDALGHRLQDGMLLSDGKVLLHHGYLFQLSLPEEGAPMLCAWPSETERTGQAAFICTPGSAPRSHPNKQARWSGLDKPLQPASSDLDEGWSDFGE